MLARLVILIDLSAHIRANSVNKDFRFELFLSLLARVFFFLLSFVFGWSRGLMRNGWMCLMAIVRKITIFFFSFNVVVIIIDNVAVVFDSRSKTLFSAHCTDYIGCHFGFLLDVTVYWLVRLNSGGGDGLWLHRFQTLFASNTGRERFISLVKLDNYSIEWIKSNKGFVRKKKFNEQQQKSWIMYRLASYKFGLCSSSSSSSLENLS